MSRSTSLASLRSNGKLNKDVQAGEGVKGEWMQSTKWKYMKGHERTRSMKTDEHGVRTSYHSLFLLWEDCPNWQRTKHYKLQPCAPGQGGLLFAERGQMASSREPICGTHRLLETISPKFNTTYVILFNWTCWSTDLFRCEGLIHWSIWLPAILDHTDFPNTLDEMNDEEAATRLHAFRFLPFL